MTPAEGTQRCGAFQALRVALAAMLGLQAFFVNSKGYLLIRFEIVALLDDMLARLALFCCVAAACARSGGLRREPRSHFAASYPASDHHCVEAFG